MLHFETQEFDSKDMPGSGAKFMDNAFLQMLDDARAIAGIPFNITSGYRSEKINKLAGGVENSSHLVGKAADIAVRSGEERLIIIMALIQVGFRRVGVSQGFIHTDNDSISMGGKKPDSIWTY
jgi:zinc D-Ala-D-Ala carboxypeptidase